jgi:hypothetical protein
MVERRACQLGRRGTASILTAMDLVDLLATMLVGAASGAIGGIGAYRYQRHYTESDRRRDQALTAVADTEAGQRAILDQFYFKAVGLPAELERLETFLATKPYSDQHADLLGPDREVVLARLAELLRTTDVPTAIGIWIETGQVISRRMLQQRRRIEAGGSAEPPEKPSSTGPFAGL